MLTLTRRESACGRTEERCEGRLSRIHASLRSEIARNPHARPVRCWTAWGAGVELQSYQAQSSAFRPT